MALTDWVDLQGAGAFSLVPSPKYAGVKSLMIDSSSVSISKKVLGISVVDSPALGAFKSQIYIQKPTAYDQRSTIQIFFRYVDTSNHYYFELNNEENPRIDVKFFKKLAGSLTQQNVVFLNGDEYFDDWFEWEFRFCKLGGSIHGEIYRAGAFLGEGVISESFSGGGAIGFGHKDKEIFGKDVFLDETEIYY